MSKGLREVVASGPRYMLVALEWGMVYTRTAMAAATHCTIWVREGHLKGSLPVS